MRAILLATVFVAAPAVAQETLPPEPYLDDRSDAAALVRSYYNAVNRKEYARAWSYFGEDKPTPDLSIFVDGYADTTSVDLLTGPESSEGAAGSIHLQVPVAIRATHADGSEKVFAGCYAASLSDPVVQGEAFVPLHILGATLEEAEGPLVAALPERCGDGPLPDPAITALARAKKIFALAHGEDCTGAPDGKAVEPESYTIEYRGRDDADEDPLRKATLVRFHCGTGAYNETHVYYQHDELNGLRELDFAEPDLDIRYENDDTDGAVESVAVHGFTTTSRLVNSFYDEASLSITAHSKWRGVGDASSTGTWLFRDGGFTLIRYEVDASYDGEINPQSVIDYDTAP